MEIILDRQDLQALKIFIDEDLNSSLRYAYFKSSDLYVMATNGSILCMMEPEIELDPEEEKFDFCIDLDKVLSITKKGKVKLTVKKLTEGTQIQVSSDEKLSWNWKNELTYIENFFCKVPDANYYLRDLVLDRTGIKDGFSLGVEPMADLAKVQKIYKYHKIMTFYHSSEKEAQPYFFQLPSNYKNICLIMPISNGNDPTLDKDRIKVNQQRIDFHQKMPSYFHDKVKVSPLPLLGDGAEETDPAKMDNEELARALTKKMEENRK